MGDYMIYYTQTDSTGRIVCTTEHQEYAGPNFIQIDFPEDFNFSTQIEYVIVDGALTHSPRPKTSEERVAEIRYELSQTDATMAELMESIITGADLTSKETEKYANVIDQRKTLRDELNTLLAEV